MKFAFIFSLLFYFGFAQEKHLTADFHLSKDVVKYESVEYAYNATIKNFEISKTQILEFKEGKLIQKTYKENSAYAAIMNRVEKYSYNEKGQLIKIDAEGEEIAAIDGMLDTIKKYRPVLLVSVYHSLEEFLKIKIKLEKLNIGYKFKLRALNVLDILNEVVLICYV